MKNNTILCLAVVFVSSAVSYSSAADYFPLAIDNVWEYEVRIPDNKGGLQYFGDATWTITGDSVIGGQSFFIVASHVTYYFGMGDTTVMLYLIAHGNDVKLTSSPESKSPAAIAARIVPARLICLVNARVSISLSAKTPFSRR